MKYIGAFGYHLALALAVSPKPCIAGDAALADTLFREAKTLMEAGEFDAACPKLLRSLEEDAATGTQIALALCQERTGALASAWINYMRAAERARHEGNLERERATRARALALAPRLSTLTVIVPPEVAAVPALEVRRNGEPVPAPWGLAVPVDPGNLKIEVTAPGRIPWSIELVLAAEKDTATVTVPPLAAVAARVESTAPVEAPVPAPRPAERETGEKGDDRLRTFALVGVAGGVVGLGLGTYFGLRASSLNDKSNAPGRCHANVCDEEGEKLRNSALRAADASTVAFIAGGILATGGVTLFLIGQSGERQSAMGFSPRAGGGALHVSGRF